MLLRFRWTGVGCLSVILWLPAVAIAMALAGDGDTAPGVAIVVGFLAGGAVNWLLGSWLNSTRTAERRVKTERHTFGTIANQYPMEHATVGYLVLALVFGASIVGRLTSPVLGWATFLGLLALTPVALGLFRSKRREGQHLAATADRAQLAQAQGWHYETKASNLAQRWKELVGWRAYSIIPFGVVGGELYGLPFTVFDAETDLDGQTRDLPCTIWAVHLPVAYPRLSTGLRAGTAAPGGSLLGPDAARLFDDAFSGRMPGAGMPPPPPLTPDDLEAHADIPGFAELLLTPEVRAATVHQGLVGWRIEGRDLVLVGPRRPTPTPAREVFDTTDRLVRLAYLFPPDAAQRYGSPPTTDVPFPLTSSERS
jgi:membrane protein YqaA with SNARE-associated domain